MSETKSTQWVANRLVELCRTGKHWEAHQELYSPEIVSVEMPNAPAPQLQGIDAVMEKTKMWAESIEEMHSAEVSDPTVVGDHFSVTMRNDITSKDRGRFTMEEICVYQVQDGKIVKEQFYYS